MHRDDRDANRHVFSPSSNAVTGFTLKGMGMLLIIVAVGWFIKRFFL